MSSEIKLQHVFLYSEEELDDYLISVDTNKYNTLPEKRYMTI